MTGWIDEVSSSVSPFFSIYAALGFFSIYAALGFSIYAALEILLRRPLKL